MEDSILLKVVDLRKYFEIKRGLFSKPLVVKAVDGVSFELKEGEAISLVGESGSGKTTLAKTILRLYEPTDGTLFFNGKDITHLNTKNLMWYRKTVQLVQQDPFGSLPYFLTIREILEEPLRIHKVGDERSRDELVRKALENVRLLPADDFLPKYPHMISGGQAQRVAIARALILQPKLIVADEPVSMLDASVRVEILMLLRELQENKKISFIYVTHDLSTSRYFSDKIFIMYAGHMVEKADTQEILREPLHPYTKALFEAIPDPDPLNVKRRRKTPAGEPPSLLDPPPGCRFHPRCPHAKDVCRRKEPPEVKVSELHTVKCWLFSQDSEGAG
ncbi:MAG: ABC transporter ATP-binding protein [Crenarchaeota archaeon]|nr:ABC transporter ATP-binding protein [Thermoproteota archaeon]